MDGQPNMKTMQDIASQGEARYGMAETELRNLKRFYDEVLASGLVVEGSDEWVQVKAARRTAKAALIIIQSLHAAQFVLIKKKDPTTNFGGK